MVMDDEEQPASAPPLQAVERALRLLHALADAPSPRTLQELSRVIGASPSTAHRMLATLARFRLVEKDPQTRRYRLGLGVLRLADARGRHVDLRWVARPHVERLRDLTLETISLSVLQGREAVDVERAESPLELRQSVQIGRPIPLTRLGARAKILLAYLPPIERDAILDEVRWDELGSDRSTAEAELGRVRATGVARSFGERVAGAAAMAVAILDSRGYPLGALIILGPIGRLTAEVMDRWEPELHAAATAIGREMGYGSPG